MGERKSLFEAGCLKNRHYLTNHRVIVPAEAGYFITSDRILQNIDQTFVAVGARIGWAVLAGSEHLHEIRIGDQGTRNRHGITVTIIDDSPDDRSRLKAPGADDRDIDGPLDCAGILNVDPFDDLALGPIPQKLKNGPPRRVAQQQKVAERVETTGDDRVVGAQHVVRRKTTDGITWMGE